MKHEPAIETPMYSGHEGARSVASPWLQSIQLITAEELAHDLRYEGPTSAFRKFCKSSGIKPVPGRKDCFDPIAVRQKLNELQGLGQSNDAGPEGALIRSVMRRNG